MAKFAALAAAAGLAAIFASRGSATRRGSSAEDLASLLSDRVRMLPQFKVWVGAEFDGDRAEAQAALSDDLQYWVERYLDDELGVSVGEHELIEVTNPLFFGADSDLLQRVISGLPIALYHGTSSALLSQIVQDRGLTTNPFGEDPEWLGAGYNTHSGVYLESSGGGLAQSYARAAVAKHGGEPVVLVIRRHLSDLFPDPDDQDLQGGQHQYISSFVPLRDILSTWPEWAFSLLRE